MVRFAALTIAVLIIVSVTLMLIVSALILLAMAAVVAIPVYLIARPHFQRQSVTVSPVERLQNLYADGKIDLFEFERRVAQLVRIEH